MAKEYQPFEVTEVAMMRALAHPVRQQILAELVSRRQGRAADLADALELPANSVSFHLRTLAKAGLIVEAPELARDKRDRVWKPLSTDGYTLTDSSPGIPMVTAPVMRWLRALFAGDDAAFLGEKDETVHVVSVSQGPMTKEEAQEFLDEVNELIRRRGERLRDARDEDRSVARPMYQTVFALGPLLRSRRETDGSREKA
ncbi:ArsR/SmtB family transcription factor [Microbacterium sediminis]|uniref:Uncharacterized protein n=1 Tax=Microbacterium sediminis TaxID=904291 RepID=A0A1B9NHC6_9MICO|nr:helix-turn-helix domain-containing protein [Microbacterium sediminis]OCG75954.1 hypothetical protein A7J15_13015 [Microbacterium sediminis]QBR73130.1 ArsR family transcriptional regulator [Microbacterium sediminis]